MTSLPPLYVILMKSASAGHDVSAEPRDAAGRWTESPQSPHAQARAPKGVYSLPTSQVLADPKRFQFRIGLGETKSGAGDSLRHVQRYDEELAGILSVWRDPENGKTYIVNGHHRLDLAKRFKVRRVIVRYLDAPNAQKAMEKGALINIAEGAADPISAAKLFRARHITEAQLNAAGVSLQGRVAGVAAGLANLCEPLWNKVVRGDMDTGRGAAIGRAFKTETEQIALDKLLERPEVRRRRLSDFAISELAKFVDTAGRRTKTILTLFGEESIEENHALEKAELSAAIKAKLAGDRRLFTFVSTSGRSQMLERAGNKMATESNRQIGQEAAEIEEVYDRLSRYDGPLARALNAAAARYADSGGARPNSAERRSIVDDLYDQVRKVVSDELGGSGGQGQQQQQKYSRRSRRANAESGGSGSDS